MRFHLLWVRGLLAAVILACGWPLRSANYGQFPLAFESNQGQADPRIQYLARGQGYGLFLGPNSATLRLASKSRVADLRMSLDGATGQPRMRGENQLPGTSQYYRGADANRWITGVPMFGCVRYEGVYPGVDLLFYGNQRSLEYDFVLSPGASARPILLSFEGAGSVRAEPSGDLLLEVPGGQVRLLKPVAYQQSGGRRLPVSASYRLKGTQVGLQLGSYDRTLPLIIDPTLNYSTYLGGSGLDGANAIAVDSSGNAYVAGWTASPNFPVTTGVLQSTPAGLTDAFVAKIGPAGTSLLFSTYLGGSSDDYGEGIALDPSGNIYVVGSTQSADFPLLHALPLGYGGGTDGFVVKLNPSGNLAYSSYLGGNGDDDARAVAADAAGNAYVAGVTGSSNFPVVGGGYQSTLAGASNAFVTKVSAAGGAMTYSTYLGGNGTDQANGIAVDSSGNAWVAGLTWSSNFPVVKALQTYGGSEDAFVAKLNATGTGLLFSTYLGGSSLDEATAIAVDGSGNAYVTGSTGSSNFPVTTGVVQSAPGGFFSGDDAFVVKYDSSGSQVSYSTYLGGSGDDIAYGIAVDSQGNAYVTGETASSNFPTAGSLNSYSGGTDAFIAVLNPLGASLLFSTFLGGSGDDSARAISIDGNGRIYVAGETSSTNFPIVPASGALQAALGGGIEDAFVSAMQYCTYSVTATGGPFSASGGTGSLNITTAAGCVWSASSNAAWLTLTSPTGGAGDGTVNFTVASNTTEQTLTATLSAGWQTATIAVFTPCDISQAGSTNVVDVQEIVNEALGEAPAANDLNHDGVANVVDIQIVIDAALGLGCSRSYFDVRHGSRGRRER